MNIDFSKTPLIVIDVQKAFNNPSFGNRNNKEAEDNIVRLINLYRSKSLPIIFIRHLNKAKDSLFNINNPMSAFMDIIEVNDNDLIIEKYQNSSFIGTNLEDVLIKNGYTRLVIVGLTTNHCVETTTRMAGNMGYEPIIINDACATFDRISFDGKLFSAQLIHDVSMASLHDDFATVLNTEEFIKYLD